MKKQYLVLPSFILFFFILASSCTDKDAPITSLSKWDYPYEYNFEFCNNVSANRGCIPFVLDSTGKVISVEFTKKLGPNGRDTEVEFRDGICFESETMLTSFVYTDEDILDFDVCDIDNDKITEVLVLFIKGTSLILRTYHKDDTSFYQDSAILFQGYDFNENGIWDASPTICGFNDCDNDGYEDILICLGMRRDRFPIILATYSWHKKEFLWRKLLSSHPQRTQSFFIDIDQDDEKELVGTAVTMANPVWLKVKDGTYYYYCYKRAENQCFCGVFDSVGNVLNTFNGEDATIFYQGIEADSSKLFYGAKSYMFAYEPDGTEIWFKQIADDGFTVHFDTIGLFDDGTYRVALAGQPYVRGADSKTFVTIIDVSSGNEIGPRQKFDGHGTLIFTSKSKYDTSIVYPVVDKAIYNFTQDLDLKDIIIDKNFKNLSLIFDWNNDGNSEYCFDDGLYNSYILDSEFKPLLKTVGSISFAYDEFAQVKSDSISVPVVFKGQYGLLHITPVNKDIFYYIQKYKWHLITIVILVLLFITVYFIQQRTSFKDIKVLGDMFGEFEVGFCLIHRNKKRVWLNKFLGNLLNLPSEKFFNLSNLNHNEELISWMKTNLFKKQDRYSIFKKLEYNTKIRNKEHKLIWGVLHPKAGGLLKKYATVVCFDQTEFFEGRWALVWGHQSQLKLHTAKKQLDVKLSRLDGIPEHSDTIFDKYAKLRLEADSLFKLLRSLIYGKQLEDPLTELTNLNTILKKVYENRLPSIEDTDIKIKLSLCDQEIFIWGIEDRLFEAFVNIVSNAETAVEGDGVIEIRCNTARDLITHDDRKYVCIEIEDNGKGISEDDIPWIFERDFTKSSDGSGFGATYAKFVIANHGGQINVQSEMGKYTIFKILLPIYEQS